MSKFDRLHAALLACYEYDQRRQTVHSRILMFQVELMLCDYITGRTK